MRVALLSPCFWPEVRRGGERFTRELADGLIARGHRPRLITSHPGLPSRHVEDGMPVLRLPRPPQGRLLRRGYEPYLTHVPVTDLALRVQSADIAHAVHAPDARAAARFKARTGRPAVLSYMGIPDHAGLMERRRRLELVQAAIRDCDAVVALSTYAAAAFERWLGYGAPVIAPGVDLATFAPASARSAHPTIVCAADAGEPRKHVALLVQALALVRAERPDAELVLSRPTGGSLAAARAAGVEVEAPGVRWSDLDSRAALAAAYGSAWCSALVASGEAFGLVALESMACGTPVVGYDDGAIPELIDRPGVGALVGELAPRALAGALLAALERAPTTDTTRVCRDRAAEHSTDACTERYLALYRALGASG